MSNHEFKINLKDQARTSLESTTLRLRMHWSQSSHGHDPTAMGSRPVQAGFLRNCNDLQLAWFPISAFKTFE